MTVEGERFLDTAHGGVAYVALWNEHLPWEVKVEGVVTFGENMALAQRAILCPPMVSRQYCVVDGVLWEPLYNFSRCLKRLVCSEGREAEEESALIASAFSTLALPVYWSTRKSPAMASPVLNMLVREFANRGWGNGLSLAYRRATRLYSEAAYRMGSSVTSAKPCKFW